MQFTLFDLSTLCTFTSKCIYELETNTSAQEHAIGSSIGSKGSQNLQT